MSKKRRAFATVFELPKGSNIWKCRWIDPDTGKKKTRSFGKGVAARRAAHAFADELERRHLLGLPLFDGPATGAAVPFAGFVEQYRTYYEASKAAQSYLTARTVFTAVAEHFGAKSIGAITKGDMLRFLLGIYKARGLAPASLIRWHAILSGVFGAAMDDGLIDANPCQRLRKKLPQVKEPPNRYLSEEQVYGMLARLPWDQRCFLEVAYETGMRRGELERLKRADVIFKDGEPHRLAVLKGKGGKGRLVPITEPCMPTIKRLLAEKPFQTRGPDFLFPYRGERYARFFREVADDAGYPDATIHALRHACGTRLAGLGIPVHEIGKWLGHSPKSVDITMRYIHAAQDSLGGVASVVNESVSSSSSGKSAREMR